MFNERLTGGVINRPAMSSLLSFLRLRKREEWFVIIDDITRFARDVVGYWDLREQMIAAGGILVSPSIEFKDDADSIFKENILASVAQHQRQKGAEQTRNRMRGRILNGYWPFFAPVGYRFKHKNGEGKVLVRDEPVASVLQEGMEGYASGRFQSQAEVKRFFESFPFFPRDAVGAVRNEQVNRILTRPLYAGYIEMPAWDISLRKGRHEPLVSFKTFEQIRSRLNGGKKAASRADINVDFPLRGMVACSHCAKPFTACWSTSKTGAKHPYYMCFAKGCTAYRKSIRREQIETEFSGLLETLTPGPSLLKTSFVMFKNAWEQRGMQAADIARSCEIELAKPDKQIRKLLDRIVDAGSDAIIDAYERRIGELERNKASLEETRQNVGQQRGTF